MPVLPTAVPPADVRTWVIARTLDGPRPPADPLARLIQSSYVNQDHTDPASVRAAQSADIVRQLLRRRAQIVAAPALQAAFQRAGWPNIVQVLTRQIHRLQRAA